MSDQSGMPTWRSTQFGALTVGMLIGTMTLTVWIGLVSDWVAPTTGCLAGLMVLLVMFHSLTVEVFPDVIRCYFGIGGITRTIRLDAIVDLREVRNPWYYGWGIRGISNGWMFNISGSDAVELRLDSGKRFRIGTSDPSGLISAIRTMGAPSPGPSLGGPLTAKNVEV